MSEAVQRLRAAKQALDEARYQRGLEHGGRWAESASIEDLEDLEELRDHWSCGGWVDDALKGRDLGDLLESETVILTGAVEPTDYRKAAFLRGFVDGALSIWDQAREQL